MIREVNEVIEVIASLEVIDDRERRCTSYELTTID